MNAPNHAASFKDQLNGRGLLWLSQIVLRTGRMDVIHPERIETAKQSMRPLIFTGWHGITMMAVPLLLRHFTDLSRFVVLMPDDWRGTALKIWADKLGADTHPLNLEGDSTMGMARQVLRLTRKVESGKHLYINPDGPDGPAQVIKPGIAYIARRAGAVIVPMGAYSRSAYIVPRWDRYSVPYPYSRITYHIGEPIEMLPEEDLEAEKLITDTLNKVTLQAAADHYEKS